MQQQQINPEQICQQALQAKMNVYQSKEQFEACLKVYNDHLDALVNLVNLMKTRIVGLEGELDREKASPENKEKVKTKA